MIVGLAYRASAIPLIWRAYDPHDYPEEGQVALLNRLLDRLHALIPSDQAILLLADRGLGTSPTWQAHLTETGWPYLLRVQRSTRIRLPGHKPNPCGDWWGTGKPGRGMARCSRKLGGNGNGCTWCGNRGRRNPGVCSATNATCPRNCMGFGFIMNVGFGT